MKTQNLKRIKAFAATMNIVALVASVYFSYIGASQLALSSLFIAIYLQSKLESVRQQEQINELRGRVTAMDGLDDEAS